MARAQYVHGGMDSFPLLAVPFFILAGGLMETGGISESTTADVSAIGSLLIPSMVRAGYSPQRAVAIVAAASAMGILVPPCCPGLRWCSRMSCSRRSDEERRAVANLVYSEKFGRLIRLDPPAELGVPTQNLIEAALERGETESALGLLAYMRQESDTVNKVLLERWLGTLIDHLLARFEQEDLRLMLRVPGQAVWKGFDRLAADRYAEAKAAIGEGRVAEAKLAVDGMRKACKTLNDLVVCWVQDICTVLARKFGEDEVARAMRPAYDQIWRERYRAWTQLTAEEQLALSCEGMRAHFGGPTRRGEFVVRDEGDRYAMFFDPCGTGGVMRRGDPESGTPPYPTDGVNTEPKPWTWGQTGVPWYNTHCNLYLEAFAAEDHGYPLRPVGYDPDPHAPCVWYVYKDPKRTRPEHFLAIGLEPPPRVGAGTAAG